MVWGGHLQVVIGYDYMGAETTQDDVMIMVDSYAGICMISCRRRKRRL